MSGDPLPGGWAATKLGAVLGDVQPGFAAGKHTSDGRGLPHLRPMNVTREGRIDRSDLRVVSPDLASKPARRLRRGDVLFNNTNSVELVGKTALFDDDDQPAFSNHMTRLRVREELADPAFVARVLHARWRGGAFKQLANNHVSQASVSRAALADVPIGLPPLPEQRRIAARLDEIDARRAASVARLRSAQAAADRLRAAVLAAACAGRLSEDWRERHAPAATGDVPLLAGERRRAEQRRFAEPQLNPHARGDELPEAWTLVPLGLLLEDLKYGTSKRSAYDTPGVPVLRIPNVSSGALDVADLKFAELAARERETLRLRVDDLLMVRSNGSVGLVGVTAAVTAAGEGMAYAGYLMRLRADREFLDPRFLQLMLSSPQLRHQIELPARSTSGVHNVNTQEVRGLGIPLPSREEQAEIVRRVTAALAHADRLTSHVARVGRTLDRMFQTALAKAFRGELVPTEAVLAEASGRAFESAEALLARAAVAAADPGDGGRSAPEQLRF